MARMARLAERPNRLPDLPVGGLLDLHLVRRADPPGRLGGEVARPGERHERRVDVGELLGRRGQFADHRPDGLP